VSGKGVPAALFMALSRSLVRAAALDGSSPSVALGRANRWITRDSQSGMFVTLFYGILDVKTGRLRFTNAGHNPPLLRRAESKRLEQLSHHTLALGIEPDWHFESREVELRHGDVLVLYTDGVTEAMNERDELFSERRLARILQSSTGLQASEMVRAVDQGVRAFVGARPLLDDVTLVVLSANHAANKPRSK
jgi:serine phosphatase RsbU (regulator of sigma subunit)